MAANTMTTSAKSSTVGYYVARFRSQNQQRQHADLAHKNVHVPAISDKMLLDDVDLRNWLGRRHRVRNGRYRIIFEELGFDAIARNLMYRDPNYYTGFGNSHIAGDWVHTNSAPCSWNKSF